ncbi:Mlp lipoprotein family protein (plasmid) [Borrelia crocidurae DOU]|uniref:Mlp lipoprotein family protein n=1 Tax=Borrelia crocidurae DOU TaxID=1293575 RepID=W5SLE8_9SPIR|nr:Mlp family lipoprotein [Borrelia crocidurae]AHH07705.1 Mlp lipoprotein family protein [Borrelia crocidurae DOU]
MHKYLKHILIYSLILIYSCTDEAKVNEETSLAPTTETPQADENKKYNAIINGFNKAIQILRERIKEHESRKAIVNDLDYYKNRITNYDQFISWIEKNPDKKKELDEAWTEAYNLLEQRRAENAPEKTLNEYINDAIDCKENPSCQDTNKYGTQDNQINFFFGYNSHEIFSSSNNIFVSLKKIDISALKDNF